MFDKRTAYGERAKSQALAWAQGRPYHNSIDDECCPDFSCCYPQLFEPDAFERWRYYAQHYSGAN